MKDNLRLACLVFVLLAAAGPTGALEPVGPASEAVLQALREQENGEPTAEDLVDGLNRITVHLLQTGQYTQAETHAQEALALAERDLGEKHQDTLAALNNLALLYHTKGHYSEAEPLYLQALESSERILGQDHPQTLTNLKNLAALYKNQGRYGEAEPLYLRALEARERTLGQDHPDTLSSINGLASLYQDQGRYGEAELLYERALEARERILGQDHPDTLGSVNNLASLYQDQGRYGGAEPLYLRALEARERVLGRDHPDTFASRNNLARLYQDQGRYGKAKPLLVRVLAASERILGQDHPRTLSSLNNLAELYYFQGHYGEAEPLFLRALETCERTLGQDHPQTLISLNNLAGLYYAQGRYSEAEPLYLRALEARERTLGQDHPQTLTSLDNLAGLYDSQGRYDEAEPLYLRALETGERTLGQDHPQTLISLNNLAWFYQAQSRYDEAEPLYKRALEASERTLGLDHPHTLSIQLNLAFVLIGSGQRDRALQELRHMDEHLRGFVGNQLDTTQRERVRRGWLLSESNFQQVVFRLALQHSEPDTLRLAADVLLRWKRLAGEAEAVTARLVRASPDPQVVKLAKELSKRRAALSRLVNLPEPGQEAAVTTRKNAIANARAEVERLEVELAGLSREFQIQLTGRAVGWEQVRSELPQGSALLSLRAFAPVDFATRDAGERHWLALLIPADPGKGPELLLRDLGPIEPIAQAQLDLRESGSKESAQALYRQIFGKLDTELTKYDRLYIAADGMLDLLAFARLVVPDGRYWVERQELRQIRTGRDLVRQSPGQSATGGMLVLGGVDYANFPAPGKKSPSPIKTQEKTTDQLLAMTRRLRDERKGFKHLKFTATEAKLVGLSYGNQDGRKAQVWRGREAAETRLKALASPPRIVHLATHGFFSLGNRNTPNGP